MEHFTPKPPNHGLIGHRGMCGIAPENTLPSFDKALEGGLNWVELDVRLSKDLELVCIHDSRIERTTRNLGWVKDYTLEELNNMDACSWFSTDYSGFGIPSLKQLVEHTQHTGVQINIEIKTPNPPSQERLDILSNALLAFIEFWPTTLPLPLVSCFDWTVLNRIRQLEPKIPLGYLSDTCSEHTILDIARMKNCSLHCNYSSLTTELIHLAKQRNVPLLTYTVNDKNAAYDLLQQGIFGVFTDFPLHQDAIPVDKTGS